jgi:hypothetical protein
MVSSKKGIFHPSILIFSIAQIIQFTTVPDIGWVGGFAPISGLILSVILGIMIICSMDWMRHKGHFEVKKKLRCANKNIRYLLNRFSIGHIVSIWHFLYSLLFMRAIFG